jgi:hypothetical protein
MVKRTPASPAGPDDPIYKSGLTIFTPASARRRPPEPPKAEPEKPNDNVHDVGVSFYAPVTAEAEFRAWLKTMFMPDLEETEEDDE